MMRRLIICSMACMLLLLSLAACTNGQTNSNSAKNNNNSNEQQQDEQTLSNEKDAVVNTVEGFGAKLQAVSLMASADTLEKSMKENYSEFVSEELIAKWINDPLNAPGRLASSPWPERIEILSVDKTSKDAYQVNGEIIEITSVEKVNGGIAAKRSITLIVKNIDNRWLISDATVGEYEDINQIVYENSEYGFSFSLPKSWDGYSVITEKWEGRAIEGPQEGKIVETGPTLLIRHPQWTSANPRQDIPIMIFTFDQWDLVQNEKISLGAAPIGPSELGRNSKYVFALPARYNFAFPTGFEEVEDILKGNPLHPLEK